MLASTESELLAPADKLKKLLKNCDWNGARKAAESQIETGDLSDEVRAILGGMWNPYLGPEWNRIIANALARSDCAAVDIGQPFGALVRAQVVSHPEPVRSQMNRLLTHIGEATFQSKPTQTWLRAGRALTSALGAPFIREQLLSWMQHVRKPQGEELQRAIDAARHAKAVALPPFARKANLSEFNTGVLIGGLWLLTQMPDTDVIREIGSLAKRAYTKIPEVGALSAKVGNACVWSLGQMSSTSRDAVSQLGKLQTSVKYSEALRLISKALSEAATQARMSTDELLEVAVPDFDLSDQGTWRQTIGDAVAELSVTSSAVALSWTKEGKAIKAPSPATRSAHKSELAELKATTKELTETLRAQRIRLEEMFLRPRNIPFPNLLEHYVHHPLMRQLTHQLIWQFSTDGQTNIGIWRGDQFVDVNHEPIQVTEAAHARLWHPLSSTSAEVISWRRFIEQREITQPFKQAHREVYPLTDAERQTAIYSNRFAAHIIRRHQFVALCKERGWKADLWDTGDPVTKMLPGGLRGTFFTESILADDTNAGIFLHGTTDRVEIELDGVPVNLATVDLWVFSELMRDVDLFVGVCSIGTDPSWIDYETRVDAFRAQHLPYWESFNADELNAAAEIRREVLESLAPRLAIRDRLSFDKTNLIVRGDRATYQIHLNSGNVFIREINRYLCIVSAPTDHRSPIPVLPFDGDNLLSLILSKALMLAADSSIKDRSILSQLRGVGR